MNKASLFYEEMRADNVFIRSDRNCLAVNTTFGFILQHVMGCILS